MPFLLAIVDANLAFAISDRDGLVLKGTNALASDR